MSDYSDLKAIAEACQHHQPLRFMRSHGALYIRNDNGIVFDVHQNRSFPEFMAQNKDYADLVLAANPATVLALIAENKRLAASVKLNLCDYPAIHQGDVDLLVAFVTGASQIELAKVHNCTPPNISRKICRVKERLGWREGMLVSDIRDRAEQLRALASKGAVVTADLMAERDQLRAEVAGLKTGYEAYERVNAELKAECEALRNALMECTDSLQGEMLQKFGGQLPEDMHPVTRREYDRDIAEVSGYRAALGQGDRP